MGNQPKTVLFILLSLLLTTTWALVNEKDTAPAECSKECTVSLDNPLTLRYGKYCGVGHTGCEGERPCDELDICCERHDACVAREGMDSCNCHTLLMMCTEKVLTLDTLQGFTKDRSTMERAASTIQAGMQLAQGVTCPMSLQQVKEQFKRHRRPERPEKMMSQAERDHRMHAMGGKPPSRRMGPLGREEQRQAFQEEREPPFGIGKERPVGPNGFERPEGRERPLGAPHPMMGDEMFPGPGGPFGAEKFHQQQQQQQRRPMGGPTDMPPDFAAAANMHPGHHPGRKMPPGYMQQPGNAAPDNMRPENAVPNMPPGFAAPNMPPGFAAPNMPPGFAAPNMPPGFAAPNMPPGNAADPPQPQQQQPPN